MPRASSAEVVRRKETVKLANFAESGSAQDSQPSGSSIVPSAGAVMRDAATNTGVSFATSPSTMPRQEVIAAVEFFRGYDEQRRTLPIC